jgi:hypothetical protein
MQKLVPILLVGVVALTPTFAVAQISSGAPGSTRPHSPLKGSGGPANNAPGNSSEPSGATTAPNASSDSSSSPSASPSGKTSHDFSQYTNRNDCVNAGGMWQDEERPAASKCEAK